MRVDVDAFLGAYPFRRVPATSPDALLRAMDRVAVDEAWVSHLPSVFWRAPAEGNAWLYETAVRERRFRPVPAVHPGLAGWENALDDAIARGAPAVRCDPTHYGLDPGGAEKRCPLGEADHFVTIAAKNDRQRPAHRRIIVHDEDFAPGRTRLRHLPVPCRPTSQRGSP